MELSSQQIKNIKIEKEIKEITKTKEQIGQLLYIGWKQFGSPEKNKYENKNNL